MFQRFIDIRDDDDNDYDEYDDDFNENNIEREDNLISPSLEYLLSLPQNKDINYEKEEDKEKITLYDFKLKNINKFKEDLLYYCLPPESLLNYKKSIDEESNYEFYKDLDCENFLLSQKERTRIFLNISNSNSLIKQNKLSNYNNEFCSKISLINVNDYNDSKLINSNLIRQKLEEYSHKYINETDKNKIFTYLIELKDLFHKYKIDMESLGLILFNYIENFLCIILNLIINKFSQQNNINNLSKIVLILLDILECFKSSNLYLFIIKFLKENQKIVESIPLEAIREKIQFIPNNCFNFAEIDDFVNEGLVTNLKQFLKNKNAIEPIGLDLLDLNDYWTLNYDDFLFVFIKSSKNNFILYLKFNLKNEKLINSGKITLLDNLKENYEIVMDINITIKNEYIYLLYIVGKSINNSLYYFLRYQIYNQFSMDLIKQNEIEFEKSFIPTNLLNDYKYFYCLSNSNQVLMIKKNLKLENKKYINCLVRLYNKDLKFSKESKLEKFKMYNFLYVNNLFMVDNIEDNKKYIGKFIEDKNNNYILNVYEFDIDNYDFSNQQTIMKITYNNNRFIITILEKENNSLFFNMSSKDLNNFIDKGILLLPFSSNFYNNDYSKDIYEYLLQQYSSFINICGNFDLVNTKTEDCLKIFPFSFSCNFQVTNLDFIINCIIENDNYNNIKLYYIIILKEIICSLFNSQIFDEEKIKDLVLYFKNLIMNNIKMNKNKLFNKILKEIIIISSYIKKYTIIEIKDIKFALDNNYKNISSKTKILIINLLLEQTKTQNQKELYDLILQLEKNYLINIFKNGVIEGNYYSLIKNCMINASEMIFKN